MKREHISRRAFVHRGLLAAAGTPLALRLGEEQLLAAESNPATKQSLSPAHRSDAKVAIVSCRTYGPEVQAAMGQCFDLLGGIGALVKGKTVAIKLNLTNGDFMPFLNRPTGETFMTHYATAKALAAVLFEAGARRVRFLESTPIRADLSTTLSLGDWDLRALETLGKVEYENTRNLGNGKAYANLRVPGGGYMFSSFELNQSYEQTDVMVSLAKLKQHLTTGITLSMKNMFGITPNSLYGSQAVSEDAIAGRQPLHCPRGHDKFHPPGLKDGITAIEPTWRVPRITVDLCAARPVHLAMIDGITAMSGGEGPWCRDAGPVKATAPGVLIAGLNPVSTDAVGTAVMGFGNPRSMRGEKPFEICDNQLLLAEQAGVGVADLTQIEVRGLSVDKARYPYG